MADRRRRRCLPGRPGPLGRCRRGPGEGEGEGERELEREREREREGLRYNWGLRWDFRVGLGPALELGLGFV